MYQRLSLMVAALMVVSMQASAKIWRVNNTAGITADFTTAQAAHNAASAGDTIHLEPSTTSYGNLTTSKRLVWLSTGEFLATHPGTQYAATPGKVDALTANNGSQHSVYSIRFNYAQCPTPAITFTRCFVESYIYFYSGANNSVVTNCYLGTYIQAASNSTNLIISNNIIGTYVNIDASSSAIITNNVLNAGVSNGSTIHNSQLQNNVFNRANTDYTFTNCNINNNMASRASLLPAGNGNVNSVDMSTVFTNYQGTDDASFIVKTGSAAKTAGYGGSEVGAFGGSAPFVLALQPGIPSIYQVSAPAAPTGNTMNVTFSTRSN